MTHRGACSADNDSGDGAGALLGIPHSFYVETLKYVMFFLLDYILNFIPHSIENVSLPGRRGT